MLKKIRLKDFKCYRDTQVNLAALTVFSGQNAVGKSTLLQALRLMRQVALAPRDANESEVAIDGPLVWFGTADDLINSRVPRHTASSVTIEVESERASESGCLVLERVDADEDIARNRMKVLKDTSAQCAELVGVDFTYLSADRICPTNVFRYPDVDFAYKCNSLGNRGEFAPWYLGMNYQKKIPIQEFLHPGSNGRDTLGQQVSLWMSNFGQEVQIEPRLYDDIRSVSFRFALWEGDSFSKGYSPINVGFGLTHCLPIFIALLSRPKSSLVLIENPESHLHPKAQVEMGRFIAKAASLGIQVLVETHSDHVLNGIRLAVKENIIASQDVALNFMAVDGGVVQVLKPNILPSGAVDIWPRGFFDEYENVSLELM